MLLGWQEILQDLYQRGVKEVLLGVFDGLNGLEEAFKTALSKSRCTTMCRAQSQKYIK